MMLLSEADQISNLQYASIIQDDTSAIAAEHLVDLAEDDAQVRARGAIFEGGECQIKPSLVIGKAPWLHVITGLVVELYRAELMYTAI
jgi:hypothetical protein